MYRVEGGESTTPQYTVPVIDPTRLFNDVDEKIRHPDRPLEENKTEKKDRLTDLLGEEGP